MTEYAALPALQLTRSLELVFKAAEKFTNKPARGAGYGDVLSQIHVYEGGYVAATDSYTLMIAELGDALYGIPEGGYRLDRSALIRVGDNSRLGLHQLTRLLKVETPTSPTVEFDPNLLKRVTDAVCITCKGIKHPSVAIERHDGRSGEIWRWQTPVANCTAIVMPQHK